MMNKKYILGVGITNETKDDILEYIVKNLENFKKKMYFVTPNPEFLVKASQNLTFKNILNKADLASADGVGIIIAAKVLGIPLKSRFTGVDVVESLCERISEKPITVGFLGGRDGVAEKTAECLQKKHPGLKVAFVGEEWVVSSDHSLNTMDEDIVCNLKRGPVASFPPASAPKVRAVGSPSSGATPSSFGSPFREKPRFSNLAIKQFSNKTIDILFVAFGAPKQEIWISQNLKKIPVKIAIGVGGAFDYISGKVPRAPFLVRKLGFEWLYRLVNQPWRIKRQFSLLKFVYLVVKEKIKS